MGKVSQRVIWWILGAGLPTTTERMPLRREWAKGSEHGHLLKHIHKNIGVHVTALSYTGNSQMDYSLYSLPMNDGRHAILCLPSGPLVVHGHVYETSTL